MRAISLEQLGSILAAAPANPRVFVSGNFATPYTLLAALDAAVPEYRLHMLNAHGSLPDRDGVVYETAFLGPAMRHHPRTEYIPARLSLLPQLLKREYRPDIILIQTSPQHHDTVSLGIECNVIPAAIEAVREHGGLVIAQANPQMPYTYGDAQIYETDIDFVVEAEEELTTIEPGPLDDVSRHIGERIATRIDDGSTLQLGIGAVPDAVVRSLQSKKGFRIWTEMFSDGVLGLHEVGALDEDVPLTASFIFGSRKLYDWLDRNKKVRIMRTEVTNNPGNIERQAQMTSVNAALQVDLYDQANASRMKGKIYSGFGGSTDFIVGALHARGGQAFIALPSWHRKADVSTIVPQLDEPVTSFQHSAVATEQGIADVFGRTQAQQARNIIDYAAHPDAREHLRQAAREMRLF
jgi:acyl-CoA hydrolase